MAKKKQTKKEKLAEELQDSVEQAKADKQALADARKMNKAKFSELLTKYLEMDLETIKRIKKERTTPVLDRIVIQVIVQAINKGDQKRLDFLMDRVIGKSEQKMDITTAGKTINATPLKLENLTLDQLTSLKGMMEACKSEK